VGRDEEPDLGRIIVRIDRIDGIAAPLRSASCRSAMTIESGLAAHFKQPEGPACPVVDWLVKIEHDGRHPPRRVSALLARRRQPRRRARTRATPGARPTMQYLADEIGKGWNPADEREHVIHIGNPHGQLQDEARRRGRRAAVVAVSDEAGVRPRRRSLRVAPRGRSLQ
jgi:hypothetical protein